MILGINYLLVILHNYFLIRNCSSHGLVVENDIEWCKIDPKLQKVVFLCFSERCHSNMCNLNVIGVQEFISRDIIPAICNTSLLKIPKFNFLPTVQHMRLKSGLKFPRPLM